MADAWNEFNTFKKDKVDTGEVGSAQFFGTAADLKGNYLYRMAGAAFGIYGNTAAEAIYPSFANDSTGAPLTGANNYTFHFASGQLPPVNAFWSLTMYEMPQSLLVANPMQPLPDQLADAAQPGARYRRRLHASRSRTSRRARTRSPTGCPHRRDRSCWCCVCTGRNPTRSTGSGKRHNR